MWTRSIIVCLALAVAGPSALAFEESQQGTVAPGSQKGAATPAKPPLNLNGTGTSVESRPPSSGTEFRIPGLGKLGVLPKFDFGLELSSSGNDRAQATEGDDVQIRGSLRHRF
jgi:hypothetical protein